MGEFYPNVGERILNSKTPNISVVVLAYKAACTIGPYVEELVSLLDRGEPDWEIILVGNYHENTGDRTPDVVKKLAAEHPRIRAVTRKKEGMMGWDMKTGLQAATGRTLVVIDGDGQMPAGDVLRIYKKLREENLDLAKTYRVQRDDGWYRVFISVVYNAVFEILFPGMNSRDINSKPKIFTRESYEKLDLRSNGWFIDAEIMIQARRFKFKIGGIGTVFHSIDYRPSFIRLHSIVEFLGNLVWYRVLEWFRCLKDKEGGRLVSSLDSAIGREGYNKISQVKSVPR